MILSKFILSLALAISMFNMGFSSASEKESQEVDPASIALSEKAWQAFASGNPEWNSFHPENFETVYDADLHECGVLISFGNAYAIVGISNGTGSVLEAGKGESSSYGAAKGKKVYCAPLSYYISSGNELFKVTNGDQNVGMAVKAPDSFPSRSLNYINPSPLDQSNYLVGYGSGFSTCIQPDSYSSIPTSFAMCLKYLNTGGQFTLSTGMTGITTIRDTLYSTSYMMNPSGLCREPYITNGFNDFCDTYTNKTVRTTAVWDDDSNCNFTYVKNQIDNDMPVVFIFNGNTPGIGFSSSHATTLVGYYRNYVSGSYTNYLVVLNPTTSSTTQKTIQWSSSYVYGFYTITVQ